MYTLIYSSLPPDMNEANTYGSVKWIWLWDQKNKQKTNRNSSLKNTRSGQIGLVRSKIKPPINGLKQTSQSGKLIGL